MSDVGDLTEIVFTKIASCDGVVVVVVVVVGRWGWGRRWVMLGANGSLS